MQVQQGQVVQGQVVQQGYQLPPDFKGNGDFVQGLICNQPPEIRSDFIRKVYSLLSIQLAVTTAIGVYFKTQVSPLWMYDNVWIYYAASFGSMGLLLGVSCCCSEVARKFPINYLFLGAITVGMGIMVGFVTMLYTTESVLIALAATTAVFFALTAFACITKTDFTGIGPYLFAAVMSLMAFGFVMMLVSYFTGINAMSGTIHTLYAGAGVLIFSLYIVYDTQLIVGGNHKKFQYGVDDYVFAALSLYLDIINLFMFILSLFGERQ